MAVATLIVALAGYLIVFFAARVLGPTLSGVFMVFWSGLYLGIGTIFGLQQESTRSVRSNIQGRSGSRFPPVSFAAAGAGSIVVVLVAASSPLWAATAFGPNAAIFTVLIVLGVLLYSGHAAVAGSLAGLRRWNAFAVLLVTEACVRAGLFGLVLATSRSVIWLAVVSAAASGSWLLLLVFHTYRIAVAARADAPLRVSVARMLQGGLAAFSSAAIITGFPVLLSLTNHGENPALLGVIILVVTLTRGPILVPLNAFLGMLVAGFVDRGRHSLWLVLRPIVFLLFATLVLAGIAFVVGAELLVLVLGEPYRIGGGFIAGCVVAAGLIGAMNIAGAAVLARGFHANYSTSWLAAALVAVGMLLVPVPLEVRVVLALIIGPVVGTGLHILALLIRR